MDWITELTNYELKRQAIEGRISDLTEKKNDVDKLIKSAKQELETMRERLNAAALASGEVKPCEYITIVRRTAWKYDDEAMLSAAKEHDHRFVRVVESLNKVELNKALEAGEIPWADAIAERVNEPAVRLDKLGDLLIIAETAE